MSKKKIYVGEDARTERKLLELVLNTNPDWSVEVWDNGLDLWLEVLNEPPSLVIVDLLLTALDGFTFCRLARCHRSLASLPILAISSMCQPETRDLVLDHGADRFLPKPFEPAQLVGMVEEMLAAQVHPTSGKSALNGRS